MPATISSLRTLRAGPPAIPPDRRPPGWSAHPANPTPLSDSLESVLSFDALHSIASGLARTQQAVPDDNSNPGIPRSIRLIATALYDVWLITWPEGSGLGAHDHGGSRSVLHVVAGELNETFIDRPTNKSPRTRVLRTGDATRGETSLRHDLVNRSGAETTSLHVYSPPLSDLTFFRQMTWHEHGQTTAVSARLPEASSGDLHLVTPSPASGVDA